MSGLDIRCLLICVWIFVTAKSAECLVCVQCTSLFQHDCISGQLAPTNCSTDSKYCIKYEGTVKRSGDKFVTRDCSDEKEIPSCRDMVFAEKDVRVCYTICQTDGCNTTPSVTSLHWTLYIISAFTIYRLTKVVGL